MSSKIIKNKNLTHTGWLRVALNMRDGPQQCPLLDGLSQLNMHFVCECVAALTHERITRNQLKASKVSQRNKNAHRLVQNL